MKGDFSRNTFDSRKHYDRVLMQQGRVQVDADWNEQLDITGHRVGTESVDVIGPAGAPKHAAAFGIVLDPTTLTTAEQARAAALGLTPLAAGDFLLTPGRFYAGGTLCQADDLLSLTKQPDFSGAATISEAGFHLVYLDVWQRHLTALDDDGIREKALGGPDTATRAKTIWQVKTVKVDAPKCISDAADWAKLVKVSTGQLAARAQPGEETEKPCVLPPGAGYRRLENQLYRVEIHKAGELGTATFKWSRDNGTVVTKLAGPVNGKEVKVDDLGRDAALGFNPGDWVELLDDANELNGTPGVLAQIDTTDRAARKVVFKDAPGFTFVAELNPKMRRWDDTDGERKVKAGAAEDDGFLELEDGVQVKFAETAGAAKAWYNTGDYWLIPARTAPNGVEWPADAQTQQPLPQAPRGIAHTYACLGFVTATKAGETITLSDPRDCREIFPPLTELEDDEEARKRHNRLLHGWGVVCGLQVHCGRDRQSVRIEPGYALECDGSEVLLPPPGRNFGVVAAAREADLLQNGSGKVALTMALEANQQINFGVRKLEGEAAKWWQAILKGTLVLDVYRDCVAPVIQFARKEFFINDPTDKRLVNETVRRRTAALNLAVQFVNQSAGSHVLLSAREHVYLERIYDDLKKFLDDPVCCGLFDGLERFPDYLFRDQGALTAFGKAPMTQVRVAADGRAAYAFGGAGDAKVYVFDLAKAELAAEIELKAVPGASGLTVRDVAFYAKGTQILVAATSANDSVLYAYKVPKLGGAYELVNEPVVVEDKQLLKLGQISLADSFMYGIAFGEGLVRFSPEKFGPNDFRPALPFQATGQWLLGAGAGAGFIYAGAAPAANAKTDRYTHVLLVSVRADRPELVQSFDLKAGGTDGFSVLFGTGAAPAATNRASAVSRLYVATEPAAGATGKRLLIFGGGGDQITAIALPTDGPVSLAPTARHEFMMVTLAEEYLLGWIDPAKNSWDEAQTLPTQMYPLGLATGGRNPLVVVANRDSHTLSLLPAGLVAPKPTLTVPDMVKYRAELIALFRALGLRLLQSLKDCFCEHLRVNCPACTENDVLELAAVEIREGKVYHICNSRRREVVTFPKLGYWLSAIPVIPLLSYLVREFCCLVLPDLFKPQTRPAAALVPTNLLGALRERLTAAQFKQVRDNLATRFSQVTKHFAAAAKVQGLAPFKPDIALRAQELVDSDEATVRRRLADRGVAVNTVADYGEAVAGTPWASLADMQFDFKPGDRVNLLVKDGKVAMITAAKTAPARADLATAPAAELVKEVERLNAKLADLQTTHASYLAAREKEMLEVKSSLDGFQKLLAVRGPVLPGAAPGGAKSRKKPK